MFVQALIFVNIIMPWNVSIEDLPEIVRKAVTWVFHDLVDWPVLQKRDVPDF